MTSIQDATLRLVQNVDDAAEMLRWLGERHGGPIAIDTETTGLRHWEDRLRLVQVGDPTGGWAIPWEDWAGVAREACARYTGQWVMHNASFDYKFLSANGIHIPWSRIEDTMTAAHLIDPRGSQALKALADRLVDRTSSAGSRALSKAMAVQGWTWATVPVDFPAYWGYGVLDTVITAHLWGMFSPDVKDGGRLARAYDLELAARAVCTGMEERGARIDEAYCVRKRAELEQYADSVVAYCRSTWGVEPTSPQKVAARLQEDGVELTKQTEKGAWSVDEEVLVALCEDPEVPDSPEEGENSDEFADRLRRTRHPLARQVLNVRKSRKVATAYFRNILQSLDGDRVHPSIRTHQALTGRMSISEPALQTLPRGSVVRDAFLPEEGHRLVCVDYSNVELRLAASFSNEPAMIEAFLEGRDLHTETALAVFHGRQQGATVTARERQIAKAVNFTLWYGGGAGAVAAQAKISEEDARSVLERYYGAFSRVREFQREVESEGRRTLAVEGMPYVESPRTGRRWPAEEDKLYTLVNYYIQGTAGEEFKRALVRLDQAGLADWAVVPVHDEVVFSIPEDAIAQGAVKELCDVMRVTDGYPVPLDVEASGPYERWGDKFRAQ